MTVTVAGILLHNEKAGGKSDERNREYSWMYLREIRNCILYIRAAEWSCGTLLCDGELLGWK